MWFPGFGSWIKALILFVCMIPLVLVFRFSGVIVFGVLGVIEGSVTSKDFAAIQGISIAMWLGTAGGLFPVYVLARVHQFFWGEHDPALPKWMPSRKSQIEGSFDWVTLLICLFFCSLMGIGMNDRYHGISNEDGKNLSILFIVIAACVYQVRKQNSKLK